MVTCAITWGTLKSVAGNRREIRSLGEHQVRALTDQGGEEGADTSPRLHYRLGTANARCAAEATYAQRMTGRCHIHLSSHCGRYCDTVRCEPECSHFERSGTAQPFLYDMVTPFRNDKTPQPAGHGAEFSADRGLPTQPAVQVLHRRVGRT